MKDNAQVEESIRKGAFSFLSTLCLIKLTKREMWFIILNINGG